VRIKEADREKWREQGRGFAEKLAGYVALTVFIIMFIYLMIVIGGIS
jgi:hypothetical protein